MPDTGTVSVVEAQNIRSVSVVSARIADFWINQLLIYGAPYRRQTHQEYKQSRELLRKMIEKIVEERLMAMMSHTSSDQWFINHLAEPYPLFLRALRECAITGSSWPRNSSTSIVFHDGTFDVRTRRLLKGRSVEHHKQYQLELIAAK